MLFCKINNQSAMSNASYLSIMEGSQALLLFLKITDVGYSNVQVFLSFSLIFAHYFSHTIMLNSKIIKVLKV